MKLYVSNIEESYKDTVIGYLGNSGTEDLSLHIIQCWFSCVVGKEKRSLPMVLYCSVIIYKYYSRLGFIPIKHNEEGGNIHNEIFNILPHFIQNCPRVNFLHDGFFVQ